MIAGLLEIYTLFSKKFKATFSGWKKKYKEKIIKKMKKLNLIKIKEKIVVN